MIIDKLLLKAFQCTADWSQNWFGINCFGLWRIFFVLDCVLVLLSQGIRITVPSNSSAVGGFLLGSVIINGVALPLILFGESRCKPPFKNPNEHMLKEFRLIMLVCAFLMTLLHGYSLYAGISSITISFTTPTPERLSADLQRIYDWMVLIESYMIVAYLYFASCTPKQPRQSKLSVLLAKLAPQPEPSFS
jgi:hypothetical protein